MSGSAAPGPGRQDNLRRIVLRERDRPGGANIGLTDLTARYAMDAGFHVVVEASSTPTATRHARAAACADHRGPTHGYYLDVPFGETLARHATKPIADDVEDERGLGQRVVGLQPHGGRIGNEFGDGLEGRCPRISGHSEAVCTPYAVGNHARVRPACGRAAVEFASSWATRTGK